MADSSSQSSNSGARHPHDSSGKPSIPNPPLSSGGAANAIDGPLRNALHAAHLAAAAASVIAEVPKTTTPQHAPTAVPVAPAPTATTATIAAQQHVVAAAMTAAPLHMQFPVPLHLLQAAATGTPGSFYLANQKASEPPSVFQNRKLRSGKWTPEEEGYAGILIELFEKGHIDEKNGCTLRSFLAKKLHCAPMRISKKYAGKGIGKMVFLSKTNITEMNGIGSPSYNTNMSRLKEAETNFLKVVYPEMGLTFPMNSTLPKSGHYHQAPQIMNGLAPLIPATPASVAAHYNASSLHPRTHNPLGTFPVWSNQPMTTTTIGIAPPGTHFLPQQQATGPLHVAVPAMTAAPQPPTNGSNPHRLAPPTQAETLQQAYLSVVNNRPPHASTAATAAPVPPGRPTASVPPTAVQQAQALHQAYLSVASSSSEQSGEAPAGHLSSVPQAPGHPHPYQAAPTAPYIITQAAHPSAPVPVGTNSSARPTTTSSGMPDFLSGFDKVASGRQGTSHPVPHIVDHSMPCSPTFTSQSFDDFHRLLGKDLSPVKRNDAANMATTAGMSAFPMPGQASVAFALPPQHPNLAPSYPAYPPVNPNATAQVKAANSHLLSQAYSEALWAVSSSKTETPGHVGADSYNIFAQQSAFAASQHSAYMGSDGRDLHEFASSQQRGVPVAAPAPGAHQEFAPSQQQQSHQTAYNMASMSSLCPPMMDNPAVVSEPSSASDQGNEESDDSPGDSPGSGNETNATSSDINSNDSDETNSESSSRKKARVSYTKASKRGHRVGPLVDEFLLINNV